AVFVQTKESAVTYVAYEEKLMQYLTDMANKVEGAPKKYGEAHRRADKAQKYYEPRRHLGWSDLICDPEFWKSGGCDKNNRPLRSKRTAKNDIAAPKPLDEAAKQYLAGYVPPVSSDDNPQPHHNLMAKASRDEQQNRNV